jgi:excisionase family DNA binding protein
MVEVNSISGSNTSFPEKNILSVREACQYMDISESFMYKLTHGKLLPCYRPNGKKLYFQKNDLEAWMTRNRQASNEEIKQIARNYIFKNKK